MSEAAEQVTATILGCASSGGVPRAGNMWGECDPKEPRNRRRRCALLITGTSAGREGKTQIVIDTGCDLREQLLDENVQNVDAVFYTHEHADHTHGIDDLRGFALTARKKIDVYFSARAGRRIRAAFSYCFEAPPAGGYPPILDPHEIEAGAPVTISGPGGSISILPVLHSHGSITTFGFKIGSFLYSCDVSGFPTSSLEQMGDLDVWVLDALRHTPHPSHLSLSEALDWVKRLQPKKAILTNLHLDMDYRQTLEQTPDNVVPAYDGMKIDVTGGGVGQ